MSNLEKKQIYNTLTLTQIPKFQVWPDMSVVGKNIQFVRIHQNTKNTVEHWYNATECIELCGPYYGIA